MIQTGIIALVGLAILAQGRPNGAEPRAGSAIVPEVVVPSETDPAIDSHTGGKYEHCAYFRASAEPKHQLLVFLPGTGGNGHGHPEFCTLAASEGYHVVCLSYPSDISMSVFRNSPDPDAFLKARESVIYGKAPFKIVNVNEANSIVNRLSKLIGFLAKKHPRQHWGQFLRKDGSIAWEKLVLAGQSQGGGHAALLAKQHEVARVLMFGSPKDNSLRLSGPAKWLSDEGVTPIDRYFSFVHADDGQNGCTYAQQLDNYRAMGLLPKYPVVDVDEASPPYRHTRLLTSHRQVKSPHTSVISELEYAKAWRYLLNAAVR